MMDGRITHDAGDSTHNERMAFNGWPDEAIEFYEGLRPTVQSTGRRKPTYDRHVKALMEDLQELADEFGEGKIFRPSNRDVRFSADKAHKTNSRTSRSRLRFVRARRAICRQRAVRARRGPAPAFSPPSPRTRRAIIWSG